MKQFWVEAELNSRRLPIPLYAISHGHKQEASVSSATDDYGNGMWAIQVADP